MVGGLSRLIEKRRGRITEPLEAHQRVRGVRWLGGLLFFQLVMWLWPLRPMRRRRSLAAKRLGKRFGLLGHAM